MTCTNLKIEKLIWKKGGKEKENLLSQKSAITIIAFRGNYSVFIFFCYFQWIKNMKKEECFSETGARFARRFRPGRGRRLVPLVVLRRKLLFAEQWKLLYKRCKIGVAYGHLYYTGMFCFLLARRLHLMRVLLLIVSPAKIAHKNLTRARVPVLKSLFIFNHLA